MDDEERIRDLWAQALAGLTVRDLRAEKKRLQAAPSRATAWTPQAIDKSLSKMASDLTRLHEEGPSLADGQREHLRVLRARIDALLGE